MLRRTLRYFQIILLVLALAGSYILPLYAKNSSFFKGLRLRDFSLLADFEKNRTKLNEYKEVLAREYVSRPNVFSNAIYYGLALVDTGEIEEASKIFEQAEKDFIANQTPVVYKGWTLAAEGDYLSAKNILYPVVKEKVDAGVAGFAAGLWLPYHVDAIAGLTLIKENLSGKDKEEIEEILGRKYYGMAITEFKSQPKLLALSISEDLRKGKIKEAEDKLNKALSWNPDNPLLLTLLGTVKYMKGNFSHALVILDKSNELNPYSPTNNLVRAKTLNALNMKPEALEAIEKVATIDPSWELAQKEKELILSPRKGFISSVASVFKKSR